MLLPLPPPLFPPCAALSPVLQVGVRLLNMAPPKEASAPSSPASPKARRQPKVKSPPLSPSGDRGVLSLGYDYLVLATGTSQHVLVRTGTLVISLSLQLEGWGGREEGRLFGRGIDEKGLRG